MKMPVPHLNIRIVQRSKGKSAVAGAAYQAGEDVYKRQVQEAQDSHFASDVKKKRNRLTAAHNRLNELEVLLCKIYEDNILGKLPDARYATLDAQYLSLIHI